jgi:hypothetical protein
LIRFNGTEVKAGRSRQHYMKTSQKQRDPLKLPLSCPMWQTTEQIIQETVS